MPMNNSSKLLAVIGQKQNLYELFHDLRSLAWCVVMIAVAIAGALIVHFLFFRFAGRMARRRAFWDLLVQYERKPAQVALPALAVLGVIPILPLPPYVAAVCSHAVGLLLIACFAWAALAMLDVTQDYIAAGHTIDVNDNLSARRVRTQVQVLRHIVSVVIIMIAIAAMLMTFPNIRHIGESLFASAGLAALVAGLAARSTLNNLFAGVQIALTQPIRLDDVVIVEGEWGWVEEIHTTYVIVRIWDLRRLVLPLSYFIEKPFQNWTRNTADLLGTVFVYVDYTVPVEAVRQEVHRILQSTNLWDEKVWGLQVTNTSDRSVELRALMSASNSSIAWDLRCFVREKLIEFLQKNYADSLPRNRAEIAVLNAKALPERNGREIDHAA
jgi:small-conductance mechanosensitive channel